MAWTGIAPMTPIQEKPGELAGIWSKGLEVEKE